MEGLVNLAGLGILQTGEDVAEDAEGRRGDTAWKRSYSERNKKEKKEKSCKPGMSRVDSLLQDLNLEGGTEHSSERGGQPKLRTAARY